MNSKNQQLNNIFQWNEEKEEVEEEKKSHLVPSVWI